MSTPCSIAGGRSIGSSAGALPCSATGDCHGCPCGAGRAIHGSATAERGAGAAWGGGRGTGSGIGQLPTTCADAVAAIVSALSARRDLRIFIGPRIANEAERLQNPPFASTRITHLPAEACLLRPSARQASRRSVRPLRRWALRQALRRERAHRLEFRGLCPRSSR